MIFINDSVYALYADYFRNVERRSKQYAGFQYQFAIFDRVAGVDHYVDKKYSDYH